METLNKSRWFVTSTNTRPGNPEPELYLITTKDKIKINEAASKLLNLECKEYLMFVSNEEGDYAIAKGTPEYTAEGSIMKGVDKKTGTECDRYRGAKMATVNGKAGFGILLGSDANNWRPLRAIAKCDDEHIAVFSISKEAVVVPAIKLELHEKCDDVILYPITFARLEEKIEREGREEDGEDEQPS